MENRQTQEPAAEAVELSADLLSGTKGFWGNLSRQQIIKLTLLGLGLLLWYPIYRQLVPFSNWVAYDLSASPMAPTWGTRSRFSFWISPRCSCSWG